jgi:hypothetical protein
MRIGLVDVDGHSNFPNLALMKLSAWHKAQGDQVEMVFPMASYDRVYMSKVFDFTPDFNTCIDTKEIIKGGTGYGMSIRLPNEVESMYPDYSLYGITDTAYGYLTRGCPRNCPFCIVGEKEGLKSYKVADLDGFWNGQKEIKLLDPNLLACKDSIELLRQLVESKAWIDFTQGLDIRLMTEEAAELIKQMKIKMLHFAWDRENHNDRIIENLTKFKAITQYDYRKMQVYVLTNYETTFDYDLYRIYKLKELGYTPYVMVYDKQHAPRKIRRLQRWVNNKFIFRVCERFEDYQKGGTK